jgi:RNA recognition motif-containing protein
MATKLYVGGLSWGTQDQALNELFAQAGTVVSAVVITDKFSGKSKGFGFVEMSTEQEAADAITKFNGTTFDGRTITVSEAKPLAPRTSTGGRSFGGGGFGGGGSFGGNRDNNRRGSSQGGRRY